MDRLVRARVGRKPAHLTTLESVVAWYGVFTLAAVNSSASERLLENPSLIAALTVSG